MHGRRVIAFHEQRGPAAAAEELFQLLVVDARQHRWIADLEAVEVQDRQYRTVGDRIEQLVGLPGSRQRPGLRLAVADDAGDDQVGVVEGRAEGMAERIAQFAAFVDRPGGGGCHMAGNAARKRELLEQLFQAGFVPGDVRVDVAPGAFEVDIADDRRAAVTGAGKVEHVQVVLVDDPVQVNIDEILAWRRAPVAHHQRLHMSLRQRNLEKGVVVQIDLPDGQIVGSPPVGVHLVQQVGRQGIVIHRSSAR